MQDIDHEALEAGAGGPESRKEPSKPASSLLAHDPYRALRHRDFRLLFIGIFIAVMGEQMVSVAIGWELYDRTGSALALGGVGLVQVLPVLVLALPAGNLADRLNRRKIVIVGQGVLVLCALALTFLSISHGALWMIYVCLLCMGGAMAFINPASAALLPQTVPIELFENAATWESTAWQLASVLGPGLGGLLIAFLHSSWPIYALNACIASIFIILCALLRMRYQTPRDPEPKPTLQALGDGLRFLVKTQTILAAITLDMFAVLLGGATTLLPIFARDILHVGPLGLGWLRAAPSIGAICVAFAIAHIPPFKRAGRTLLFAVAGFGFATIIFGLSRSFWLSLSMLFLLGGFDSISVIIRSTLLLTRTPDGMRGRVSSVNTLFISASNELGGFESGLVAQFFGPLLSVVGGGIGTVLVVLCVALCWPEMRRLRALSPASGDPSEPKEITS